MKEDKETQNSLQNDLNPQQFGRYRIIRVLGQGGMGRVFLAEDPLLERQVALKAISIKAGIKLKEWREFLQRFMTEARASARLNHPSIVTIYDTGEHDGVPWIAFEYIKGDSLEDLLIRSGKLKLVESLAITYSLALALQHAHSFSIIHRDIKPSNILISELGIAKLADFGIAKAPWSVITKDGITVGSPGYMSPEQIKGLDLDGRADIFSLGVILYTMLSGMHPFQRDSLDATVMATMTGEHSPLDSVLNTIPDSVSNLVEKCLQADRTNRMASATAMLEDLQALDITGFQPSSLPNIPLSHLVPSDSLLSEEEAAKLREFQMLNTRKIEEISPPEFVAVPSYLERTYPVEDQREFWKKTALALLLCLLVIIIGFMINRQPFVSKSNSQAAQQNKPPNQQLPGEVVRSLKQRALEGNLEEALSACTELRKFGYDWPGERLLYELKIALERNDINGMTKLAEFFQAAEATRPLGLVVNGRIAVRQEKYPEAGVYFSQVRVMPSGNDTLKQSLNDILIELAPRLERDGSPPTMIKLIARDLRAADHAQVKTWLKSTNDTLRWNAVAIRQEANLPVDMVDIFILDLTYGSTWQMRKNAVTELGYLKDERAIPALVQARKKGLRDPLVSNAARTVLKKVFPHKENEDE